MRRLRLREQQTGFGVFLLGTGMGLITNLVTGDPGRWPRGLQPIAAHAPLIGAALFVAVGARAGWDMWRNGIVRPEWTGGNPYPGLMAYTESRAGVFFGRRREVEELVTRVRQARATAGRFVPVVGPSGSGKSSLVLAGLLPALRSGNELRIAPPFGPGGNAVGELAVVLGIDLTEPARAALDAAQAGGRPPRPGEVLAALATLRAGARGLLLIVDQLEEAVTLCVEEDRHAFLALIEAMLEWEPRLRVVATVRSDTVGAFQHGPGRDLFRQPLMVNVLGSREIREIVQEPARLTATVFDDGLIDEIVRDSGGGDALPLLSYLLSDLYRGAARDHRITWREYEAGGGVSGAITRQALAAVAEVSGGGDALEECLDTLLRFVTIGPGGATRQPVRSSSLNDRQRRVVQAFVDARLLISDTDVYFIAHEALLRQWQPLSDHILGHEENLRRLTELVPMARAWQRSGRQTDYLISGARLVDALGWAGDGHGLPEDLREFLAESQRNQAGEMDRRANQMAREALAALPDTPEQGIALALAAYTGLAPTAFAARALEAALADGLVRVLRHPAGVASLAFDGTGRLAVGRVDGIVSVWPRSGPGEEINGPGEPVTGVAFAPDGRLAAATMDGTITVQETRIQNIRTWGIARLAARHDGRWVIGAADGSVRTVDADLRDERILHAAATPAYAIAVSDDGRVVAGFGDGVVLMRDEARETRACEDAVFAVATGPDDRVAAGGRDGRIVIWDTDGEVVAEIRERDPVTALQYTPDGDLACGLADGLVKVRAPGGGLRHLLTGHFEPVSALACAADGRLAAGSSDGTVRIWDLGGRMVRTIEAGEREGSLVAEASDGRSAKVGPDGSVRMEGADGYGYVVTPPCAEPATVSFDADGRLAVGHHGVTRVWPYGTDPERLLALAARHPREQVTP